MKLTVRRPALAATESAPGTRAAPTPAATATDHAFLRIGAVAGITGILVQVLMEGMHPSRAAPNDSAAAFLEYAASTRWTYVHIGQFLGTLLVVLSLLALARPLSRQPGYPGALATVGAVTAALAATVFAVQMAVDGVALRQAVDTWVAAAPGPAKTSAFQVAEGVRALEKGLSGFFHLANGLTLVALGLSLALGLVYPRWLGWTAVASGSAFLVGGVITARTGFSPQAGQWLTPALVLLVVFLVGASVPMWRGRGTA